MLNVLEKSIRSVFVLLSYIRMCVVINTGRPLSLLV